MGGIFSTYLKLNLTLDLKHIIVTRPLVNPEEQIYEYIDNKPYEMRDIFFKECNKIKIEIPRSEYTKYVMTFREFISYYGSLDPEIFTIDYPTEELVYVYILETKLKPIYHCVSGKTLHISNFR